MKSEGVSSEGTKRRVDERMVTRQDRITVNHGTRWVVDRSRLSSTCREYGRRGNTVFTKEVVGREDSNQTQVHHG